MRRVTFACVLAAGALASTTQAKAEGDAAKGAKLFKGFLRCNACHALEPEVKKVGPTLAGLFGRKAGSVETFDQYSDAMANSGIVWSEETLSAFLADPQKLIPGNRMKEGGYVVGRVSSKQHRVDLIAFLREATTQ